MTLRTFLEECYLPNRPGMAAGTIEQYKLAVKSIDLWHGEHVRLCDLCRELVHLFMSAQAADGRTASTVNSKRRTLLTLWRAAADDDLCEWPRRVRRFPETKHIPSAWTIEEIARLIEETRYCPGQVPGVNIRWCDWWTALVTTLFVTGCRVSPMLTTRSKDVDLEAKRLTVVIPKVHCEQMFSLTTEAVDAIRPIYDRQRELVWYYPFRKDQLWREFRKIVEAAGLEARKYRAELFHRLRRSHISYVAAKGGHEAARLAAGHADIRMTEKHYLDPRISGVPDAAKFLPTIASGRPDESAPPRSSGDGTGGSIIVGGGW
jgi:integrase